MNPIHRFYFELYRYLRIVDTNEKQEKQIIELASKTPSLSWKPTLEDLRVIHIRSHRPDHEFDDSYEECDALSVAAFKDLSPMKNPRAITLFEALNKLIKQDDFVTFFGRKVSIRENTQSAVIVLHVSNVQQFEELMKRIVDGEDYKNLQAGGVINP